MLPFLSRRLVSRLSPPDAGRLAQEMRRAVGRRRTRTAWSLVAATLAISTLVIGPSVSAQAVPTQPIKAATATYCAVNDHISQKLYYWKKPITGSVYSSRNLKDPYYDLNVFANDNLGVSSPQVTLSGGTKGKLRFAFGSVFYAPFAAGSDSFIYTATDKDGVEHSATVYVNNVGLDVLKSVPIPGGFKLTNPNSVGVYVQFGKPIGSGYVIYASHYTVKSKQTYSFKPGTDALGDVSTNGKIAYAVSLPDSDTGTVIYTSTYLTAYKGVVGAVKYTKLSSTSVKVKLGTVKAHRSVTYVVTYLKGSKTYTSTRVVKAGEYTTVTLKGLKSHSIVKVKIKVASGSGVYSYKSLASKVL